MAFVGQKNIAGEQCKKETNENEMNLEKKTKGKMVKKTKFEMQIYSRINEIVVRAQTPLTKFWQNDAYKWEMASFCLDSYENSIKRNK